MNKRITSLLLCFVMVFTMLAAAVPALAAGSTSFNIKPDKTEARPGDTISYTISLGAATNLRSIKIKLSIPEGLTYVAGSGKTPDGLEATLNNAQKAAFTESTKVFIVATADGYTSTTETLLMEFKCTVNEGASGNKAIDLIIDPDDIFDTDYNNIGYVVNSPAVNITTPHTHVYDQTHTDAAHLKTPATCTEAAVYYKSCTCGENGTETFTSGSALGHDYTQKFEDTAHLKTAASKCTEHNIYWFDCSRCDSNAKNDPEAANMYFTSATTGNHTFGAWIDEVPATCKTAGIKGHKDCNDCNKHFDTDGSEITDLIIPVAPANHEGTLGDWVKTDPDKHWKEYSCCHVKVEEGTHVYTDAADTTCNTCGHERTVAPTHPVKPTIAVTGTYTYNGNVQTATVTGYDPATMNISGNTGTDAGSYTVSVTSKTGQWADGSTDAVTANWSIGKANAGCTAPTAKPGLTYNGAAQELITAGTAFGGTMKYSTNGNDWFDEIPTGTNAGSYTVYYKVIGDRNHNDNAGGSVDVTINKATPTGKPSYTPINEEGKTLDDVNLDAYDGNYSRFTYNGVGVYGTITWLDDAGNPIDEKTPVEKNKPYKWKFTPNDDNYNSVEGSITPWDESGNGSIVIIVPEDDATTDDKENPTTGAAVSGSGIGYACAALAAVGAIYVGAKKLAKKDEE